MATSINTGDCAACGKAASTHCSRCTEGVDINGNPSKTFYCGRDCQQKDFEVHKVRCRHANARKQLYRAGDLLQEAFYAFRRATFGTPIENVTLLDGVIQLQIPLHREDGKFLVSFPDAPIPSTEDQSTVLAWMGCRVALAYMFDLTKKSLQGILDSKTPPEEVHVRVPIVHQRVVRSFKHGGREEVDFTHPRHSFLKLHLVDGYAYVVDLAGAQYGQHRPVVPLDKYTDQYVEEIRETREFGAEAKYHLELMEGKHNDDVSHYFDWRGKIVEDHVIKVFNKKVQCFEFLKKPIAVFLEQKSSEFKFEREYLVYVLELAMREYLDDMKQRSEERKRKKGNAKDTDEEIVASYPEHMRHLIKAQRELVKTNVGPEMSTGDVLGVLGSHYRALK